MMPSRDQFNFWLVVLKILEECGPLYYYHWVIARLAANFLHSCPHTYTHIVHIDRLTSSAAGDWSWSNELVPGTDQWSCRPPPDQKWCPRRFSTGPIDLNEHKSIKFFLIFAFFIFIISFFFLSFLVGRCARCWQPNWPWMSWQVTNDGSYWCMEVEWLFPAFSSASTHWHRHRHPHWQMCRRRLH